MRRAKQPRNYEFTIASHRQNFGFVRVSGEPFLISYQVLNQSNIYLTNRTRNLSRN